MPTQKRADKVAKADPELSKQVAHGEVSLPKAVEQITGKRPGAKAHQEPIKTKRAEKMLAEPSAAIVASAQDWAMAQTVGNPSMKAQSGNLAPLATRADSWAPEKGNRARLHYFHGYRTREGAMICAASSND